MEKYSANIVEIQKGDKLNCMQCSKIELEHKQMDHIPCASIVESLNQTLVLLLEC